MKFEHIFSTILLYSIFGAIQLNAQQSANTLKYDSLVGSPRATIADIAWLAGYWEGEAFGGKTEEIWSFPSGGSMMGSFKLVAQGKTSFFELESIIETEGTLNFQLRHFSPEMRAWEEKDKPIVFRLVKLTEDRVYFDGLTIERISEDEINMYLIITRSGKESEMKFNYKRRQ